jgi:putative SOS response-associated peptidase YedK
LQPVHVAITDRGPIVRASSNAPGEYELIMRRWSWPGSSGKPVYNFRSEGRDFSSGRCLVIGSGFYEFTKPADPKQKRKDRWLFTNPDEELIGIAGLVRDDPGVGEAFTMLTTEPGPDVAPYHNRQVAVLSEWRGWLDHMVPAKDLLVPAPAGSLTVRAANR